MIEAFQQLSCFCILLVGPVPFSIKLASHFFSSKNQDNLIEKGMVFLTTWVFTQIFLAIFLGITGLFFAKNMLVAEILIGGVGIYFLHRCRTQNNSKTDGKKFKISTPFSKFNLLLCWLSFLLLVSVFWNQLVWPIVEIDSLGYHLPSAIKLVQSGKISFLEHFWFQEHFPRNWEMLEALFLLPFHQDLMVLFPNLIAWIVFGLSTAQIAKTMDVSNKIAYGGAFLLMLSPLFLSHLQTANVDFPFAAFFLLTFYFLLKLRDENNYSSLTVLCMSASIFIGIKSTGILYLFLLIVLILFIQFVIDKKNYFGKYLSSQNLFPTLFLIVILLCGLFWYFYNFFHYANPMLGIEFKLGEKVIFPGVYAMDKVSTSSLANAFNFSNAQDYKTLTVELFKNFSITFFFSVLLSLIFISQKFSRFKSMSITSNQLLLLITLVTTFFIYLKTPFSGNYDGSRNGLTSFVGQEFRFSFPFIGLLGVMGALGLEKLKLSNRQLLPLFIGLFCLSIYSQKKIFLLGFLLSILIPFLKDKFVSRVISKFHLHKKYLILIIPIFLFGFGFLISHIQKIRNENRLKRTYGLSVQFIDTKLNNQERIGFPVADEAYTLFGSNFSHEVFYIPFDSSNFQNWIKKLDEKKISVVAIGPPLLTSATANLLIQIENSPMQFKRVYGSDTIADVLLFQFHP